MKPKQTPTPRPTPESKSGRNWLRILIVSLGITLLLAGGAVLIARSSSGHDHAVHAGQSEKGTTEKPAPFVFDPDSPDCPDAPPVEYKTPWGDNWDSDWAQLIEPLVAMTPPPAVLIALLCGILIGPRWLRMTLCAIAVTLVVSCGHSHQAMEKQVATSSQVAGGTSRQAGIGSAKQAASSQPNLTK